jgi:hypothetical protein
MVHRRISPQARAAIDGPPVAIDGPGVVASELGRPRWRAHDTADRYWRYGREDRAVPEGARAPSARAADSESRNRA